MKDEIGRDMARLGDTTDHGGKVVEAAPDLTHMGVRVALDGHQVECPKCGGTWPIVATEAYPPGYSRGLSRRQDGLWRDSDARLIYL
jgi:hypothetical protein